MLKFAVNSRPMKKLKVAVVYSTKAGLEVEFRHHRENDGDDDEPPPDYFAEGDNPETVDAILHAFRNNGHTVSGFEADNQLIYNLTHFKPEIVFNVAEGLYGDCRESFVPIICERLGIPYSGSTPLTLALCLNKDRAKEIMKLYRIATPAFRIAYPGHPNGIANFSYPAIIKPTAEGSSKGIFEDSVVYDKNAAHQKIDELLSRYKQTVLIEKFLPGAEFTVAIWGNGSETEVLPIIKLDFSQLPASSRMIYSFEAKWLWDTNDKPLDIFQCPAEIDADLAERIRSLVKKAYRVFQIRDWCRVDVRLDENGIPHIIELNPLPGILPDPRDNSCFPKAARSAGYSFDAMLNRVLEFAAKRSNGSR
jgi:D-alanine-D-alanine ligase